jgi:hypothetical protein
MANTGVLPFVRGVDFTSNDFSVSALQFEMSLQNTRRRYLFISYPWIIIHDIDRTSLLQMAHEITYHDSDINIFQDYGVL